MTKERSKVLLTVSFVRDREMRKLNRKFRGIKIPSNVVTYSLDELEDGTLTVGDIVIDLDEARREAKRLNIDLRQELLRLIEHGARNLLKESQLLK